ncbi:MAG TPA: hypothetical protein VEZ20_03520 [Allosphingosinicella sp.]|jgi:hypothetical protein|nr:hypothetical protein [Allosphingosinicella sp.]
MCLAQDAMVFRFAAGPDMLVMASLIAFYAVQLARNTLFAGLSVAGRPA